MNTSSLKKFAVSAREKLMNGVADKILALGFDKKGNVEEKNVPQRIQGGAVFMERILNDEGFYDRWMSLYQRVKTIGIKEVVEEAAYTWFNRLMAVKIMQENGWIDRVLDFESEGVRVPLLVANARRGVFPAMSVSREQGLRELLEYDTKTTEQFNLLITDFCKGVPVINKCFGKISDYTELLLPTDVLSEGGIVDMINHTEFISEDDFKQSELIGWLYQFYISEKKDAVFASFKDKKKAEAEDIPAATQIFTPNWIVKYMVQNTVGRIYLDNNPYADEIKDKMEYLVEKEEGGEILRLDSIEEMKVADLACGSGHILNEAFDLLYDIYLDEGYGRRQAIENIFKKNLLGIDLDTRAKQLSMFALLMKACRKDESFLDAEVMPKVYDMPDPFDRSDIEEIKSYLAHFYLGGSRKTIDETAEAVKLMDQAKNLGSIMKFDLSEQTRAALQIRMDEWRAEEHVPDAIKKFYKYADIILALTDKYHALVMNPPYMGRGNMNASLSVYLDTHYVDAKTDLFSTFIAMALDKLVEKGRTGLITMESWMFLSSFENLRKNILENYYISSLGHFGWHIIGIAFGTVMTIFEKSKPLSKKGEYSYLTIDNISKDTNVPYVFPKKDNGRYSITSQKNFTKIPGSPIGYWVNEKMVNMLDNPKIGEEFQARQGLATGDNDRFLRLWFEVSRVKFGIGIPSLTEANMTWYKWFPYKKGGSFRRWYGNQDYVVDWDNDGFEIKHNYDSDGKLRSRPQNTTYYFKESISWSLTSSLNSTAFRYYPKGFIFDVNGMSLFADNLISILSFLNTKFTSQLLQLINPTMACQVGDVNKLPILKTNQKGEGLVKDNISISKTDWDAHETSWDFEENELIKLGKDTLSEAFEEYRQKWADMFYQLHSNEEELNRQFIEIYGLQDELTPDVPLDEITILQQGEIKIENGEVVFQRDEVMRQFVSYLVGLIMGRYRLDKKGLNIAHPEATDEELAPYTYRNGIVEIDGDGILPLMGGDCSFVDNALKRLSELVRVIFGDESHARNMAFINDCLGKSLEDYLTKDFYADHLKRYQKRPIYWLFSSKKGAFKVLAYMHRMDRYTAEMIRNKYLLPHIESQRVAIADLEQRMAVLTTAERKKLEKLRKEHEECIEYHERLHAKADEQIGFDLDDGVVVNYAKFGDVLAKLK